MNETSALDIAPEEPPAEALIREVPVEETVQPSSFTATGFSTASTLSTFDLDVNSATLTIFGDDASDQLGRAVAVSDVNNDGFLDIIVGASAADGSRGTTYVFFGRASFPSSIDLNGTSANVTILGINAGDGSGGALAVGDVNNDGFNDVIIGASTADPAGGSSAGETYVVFGSASLPSTINLATSANVTIFGNDSSDFSGTSVASGDVNNDGFDDVIIGAPFADPAAGSAAGETYVIFGSSSMPSTIDLNSVNANVTIFGDDAGDRSGTSVAAGDVNNDGIEDVIIGAELADGSGDAVGNAGDVYVIFGRASFPSSIDLNGTNANVTIFGDDANDESGTSVAVSDVNNDSFGDVIIGARAGDGSAGFDNGEVYIIFGSSSLPLSIDLATESANVTIFGDDLGDNAGRSVASGDVNNDGFQDVIIGANAANGFGNAESNRGETYVIFGSATINGIIDLDSVSANVTIFGDDASDVAGFSVAVGDVNNDSFADVVIGANQGDGSDDTQGNAGEVYMLSGRCLANCHLVLGNATNVTSSGLSGTLATTIDGATFSAGDILEAVPVVKFLTTKFFITTLSKPSLLLMPMPEPSPVITNPAPSSTIFEAPIVKQVPLTVRFFVNVVSEFITPQDTTMLSATPE